MDPATSPATATGSASTHEILGMTHQYQVTPAESDGRYLAFVMHVPPGCGSPMHRHEVDSEFFHVLEGELTIVQPSGQRAAAAGSSVFLPAGGAHAFHNAGNEAARVQVIASPGIEAERFFAEIDAATRSTGVDLAVVSAAAHRHRLTILAA